MKNKLQNKDLDVILELTQHELFYICRTLRTRNTKESKRILKEIISTFIDYCNNDKCRRYYFKDLLQLLRKYN